MDFATPSIATHYTHDFVRAHLPERAMDILEIGCGRGELAAQVAADGFRLLAIDGDPECVAATARLGVECVQTAWPADLGRTFDAILFTRSLHHISPLDESVAAARQALRPGGTLIVEDFRSEGASPTSSAWYRALVGTSDSSGAFADGTDLAELLAADDVDGHELNSSVHIEAAIRHRFSTVEVANSAYYFRYLEPSFRTASSAQAMLADELAVIASGVIEPLGKRFVAHDG